MIGLIDGDSLLWWAINPIKMPTGEGNLIIEKTPDSAKEAFDDILDMVIKRSGITSYIGFLSSGRSGRELVYPEYKANRSGNKPELISILEPYVLEKHKFNIISGYEADDCIASSKRMLEDTSHVVISLDKDLLNLEGNTYDYKNDKRKYNSLYQSEEFFWRSMIIGDSADNVKGIPGKGEKATNDIFAGQNPDQEFHELVLTEYITTMGQRKGVMEFYKNYVCLRLNDEIEGFVLPQPIQI